jgi:DNA topoisomerase-1
MRIFAGECTTTFEGTRDRTQRGAVVVVVKPDKTVLVHDADGYQPVAWLTRPDSVTIEADGTGFAITARTAEQTLRVVSHDVRGEATYPVTEAGVPVGRCPNCVEAGASPDSPDASGSGGALVRTGGDVVCLQCGDSHALPAGATVLEKTCDDCGLPTVRVERGAAFEVCIDYRCDPLDERVAERFDREWTCPDCGDGLRILRARGRLLAGCDSYPDCETAFSIPAGVVAGGCDCGLPVVETATGRRCLDGTCDVARAE